MNDLQLKKIIKESIQTLSNIQERLKRVSDRFNESSFREICDVWEIRCKLASELSDAIFLIDCIEVQTKELQQLKDRHFNSAPLCGETPTSFNNTSQIKIIRTLSVTTYLTAMWSLYDKLANVIGRLLGSDDILKNPMLKENPKLIGTFIGYQSQKNDKQNENKKILTFVGINNIVRNSFDEHICLSYLVRNCFVHEGGTIGKRQIFIGETSDGIFNIDESIAKELNEEIDKSYSIKNPTIAKAGDLIDQLNQCHYEINKCFIGLLMFAIGSFRIQVEAFLSLNENL